MYTYLFFQRRFLGISFSLVAMKSVGHFLCHLEETILVRQSYLFLYSSTAVILVAMVVLVVVYCIINSSSSSGGSSSLVVVVVVVVVVGLSE